MKITSIPGKFNPPEYEIPLELKLILKRKLFRKKSDDSNPTSVAAQKLKWIFEQRTVPSEELDICYQFLLFVEQYHLNEQILKHRLFKQSPTHHFTENCLIITVPDLNMDDPFVSNGDLVYLHDRKMQTKHLLYIVDVWKGRVQAEPRERNE